VPYYYRVIIGAEFSWRKYII